MTVHEDESARRLDGHDTDIRELRVWKDKFLDEYRSDQGENRADMAVVKDNLSGLRRGLWMIFGAVVASAIGLLFTNLSKSPDPASPPPAPVSRPP